MHSPSKALPTCSRTPRHIQAPGLRPGNPYLLPSLILCALCVLCGKTPASADLVLLDAQVLTADAKDAVHEALAVENGRILAVGTTAEIEKLVTDKTKVLRLGGKTVVPGLIETHCHAIGVARASLSEEYVECADIAEIQSWIRERATATPPGTWLRVPRVPITRLTERRHPTIAELDAATTTHPVVFNCARKDIFNSLGFEKLGIPLNPGGEMPKGVAAVRAADGTILALSGAGALLQAQTPPAIHPQHETDAALLRVLAAYNQVGITSIFERATDIDGYRTFRRLRDEGKLTVRVTTTFRKQASTAAALRKFVEELRLEPREGDDWVRAGALKITVDGGIHWGNTRLSEPYGEKRNAFYLLDNPEYRGDLSYSVEEMTEVFGEAHRLGWQMSAHVTGDEGVERVLDALAALDTPQDPVAAHRFNLIHAYFPTPNIVERSRALGVGVDTQSYLYYKDSDWMASIYGPSWADMLIGAGSWLRGGVPVALNSDHMIGLDPDKAMNAYNPFLMLYIAVTRKNEQGEVHGPGQKLSRLEALRCVTANAAWLAFDEDVKGSLEPGKLADLVVLDRDYLACPDEEIRGIKPLLTMVDGRIVFER